MGISRTEPCSMSFLSMVTELDPFHISTILQIKAALKSCLHGVNVPLIQRSSEDSVSCIG